MQAWVTGAIIRLVVVGRNRCRVVLRTAVSFSRTGASLPHSLSLPYGALVGLAKRAQQHETERSPFPLFVQLQRASSLLWCGFTLVGCADNKGLAAAHWDGTVDTLPNGTMVVHIRGRGIWDAATAWRVVEEVRIGTLERTGPDLFGRISAIEVDRTGRIYVLESQAAELRVFEPSGRHVRTFGRRGSNPGDSTTTVSMPSPSPAGGLSWSVSTHC